MQMAPRSFPLFGLLSVVLVAFALSARALVVIDVPPPAVAAAGSRFLRACCANTTNASACYDFLLPYTGSFHGNRVRVARPSAVLAFARLRIFHDELHRLPPGATGAGRMADMVLQFCKTTAEIFLGREGDSLAELQRLETAAGRRGERAWWDLNNADLYVSGIRSCAISCIDDFASIAALASSVGKQVVAWGHKCVFTGTLH